jgi:hypothetical protein
MRLDTPCFSLYLAKEQFAVQSFGVFRIFILLGFFRILILLDFSLDNEFLDIWQDV